MNMSDKMRGIIIYAPEDVDKNKKFIRICREYFKGYGIDLELVILKHKNQTDLLESTCKDAKSIDFAINRSRNGMIAEQLEMLGVRVFNSSRVTRICNDKWETYLYAEQLGIEVMKTDMSTEWNFDVSCREEDSNKQISKAQMREYPKVVKSRSGHGGKEVFLVQNAYEFQAAVNQMEDDYIIQELADAKGNDIRVYVIGNQIVTAIRRSAAEGFKSNYSQGGMAQEYCLNTEETKMIMKVIEDLHPDYVGIDFFYDGDRMVLNEIEDAVGARMVYENTQMNIVERYAEYITKEVYRK